MVVEEEGDVSGLIRSDGVCEDMGIMEAVIYTLRRSRVHVHNGVIVHHNSFFVSVLASASSACFL